MSTPGQALYLTSTLQNCHPLSSGAQLHQVWCALDFILFQRLDVYTAFASRYKSTSAQPRRLALQIPRLRGAAEFRCMLGLICFDEPHPFVLQRTARADDRVLVQSVGVEGRRQPAPGSQDKTGCLSSCWQGSLASKATISVIILRMGVKFSVSHLSWVSLTPVEAQ